MRGEAISERKVTGKKGGLRESEGEIAASFVRSCLMRCSFARSSQGPLDAPPRMEASWLWSIMDERIMREEGERDEGGIEVR